MTESNPWSRGGPRAASCLGARGLGAVLLASFLALTISGATAVLLPLRSARASDGPRPDFVRGDASGDGSVDLADVLSIVVDVFPLSGFPPTIECEDAADANDDGALSLVDVYLLLSYLFGPGLPPSSPFPMCGSDPTPDGLSCNGPTNCP